MAYVYKNLGYYTAASLNSAKTLAVATGAAIPTGAVRCWLQALTQNINVTDDGTTAPTTGATGVGFTLFAGDPPTPYEGELDKLQFIEAAASATLKVSYYGQTGER